MLNKYAAQPKRNKKQEKMKIPLHFVKFLSKKCCLNSTKSPFKPLEMSFLKNFMVTQTDGGTFCNSLPWVVFPENKPFDVTGPA
jgi:hypothetical protein